MAINTVIHTNQHSVDRVVGAGVPVLLVFGRSGAALSQDVAATLEHLAAVNAGKLLIARVDAHEEPALVQRFGVRQLPSIVVLQSGEVVERLSGALRSSDVEAWVNYLVHRGPRPVAMRSQPANDPAAAAGGHEATGAVHPLTLTDYTFAQTLQSPLPVLVDFWAPWCGPCRMIAPSVDRLAQEYAGRAIVAKLNVDENPATPGQFGIRGIPALLIFKGGTVVDQIVGAQPYAVLEQRLARHVA